MKYPERINAVSAGDIRAVAERLFLLDAYSLAEVGPFEP